MRHEFYHLASSFLCPFFLVNLAFAYVTYQPIGAGKVWWLCVQDVMGTHEKSLGEAEAVMCMLVPVSRCMQ